MNGHPCSPGHPGAPATECHPLPSRPWGHMHPPPIPMGPRCCRGPGNQALLQALPCLLLPGSTCRPDTSAPSKVMTACAP